MKIYTKTGDRGETSLLGGKRVQKSHLRIEAYGTIDELNAYIGLLADQNINQKRIAFIESIQEILFVIGASLASEYRNSKIKKPVLGKEDIMMLEKAIDEMEEGLSPLKHFLLPGGHPTVSLAHVVRTVCRRAERCVVALNEKSALDGLILEFLNRLSDYLFVLGRQIAKELNVKERAWLPRV
ncbi:MAG: cob(I)yrinic acid a,c-diamide adenosyltransferase [Cyclobacteriaceae bacterium]